MSALSRFFHPRTIAFIGATEDESKLGGRRYRSLVEGGFGGEIYPVHPRNETMRGLTAHRSVLDIPVAIDLAVVVVPHDAVQATIADCAARSIPAVMLISSGFGEIDDEGRRIEASMANQMRDAGGRMVGPNCAGLFSAAAGINLGGAEVPVGSVALVSQSGNLLLDFNLRARGTGLGFSRQVAIGNAADLDGVDLIADSLDDPDTTVVLAYLEGFAEGRGRALVDLAQCHPLKKPIVLLKPGRSELGKLGAITHTGTLAGEDRVTDAALRQAGILRAPGIAEAWEMVDALCRCRPLDGERIALVSDGGGHATVLADSLGLAGFTLPRFSADTQRALAAFLPSRAAIANPLDFAGVVESDPSVLPMALKICFADPGIDAVAVAGHFGGYHRIGGADLEASEIAAAVGVADLAADVTPALVFQSIHADTATKSLDILRQSGIPVSRSPEGAARALTALRDIGLAGDSFLPKLEPNPPAGFRDRASPLLRQVDGGGALAEPETRDLLAAAGFDIPQSITTARIEEAARVAWPNVALKLIVPGLVHRSGSGAVLLNLAGEFAIRNGAATLFDRYAESAQGAARLLVTPMIEPGLELLCGAFRDPQFGPMIMVGLGGVQVEVLDDVVMGLVPLSHDQALRLIARIQAQPLLDGYRGAVAVDRDQLAEMMVKLAEMMMVLPDLSEIEINPVIVTAGGPRVADARARVRMENTT
jgi:acetate---CoA ligase (ADP-forming)